jgi:hypothetical protein
VGTAEPGGAGADHGGAAGADEAGGAGAGLVARSWDGRTARVLCRMNSPETLPAEALKPRSPATAGASTALPLAPAKVPPAPARPRPAPVRLSYTQLADYSKCGYRFYLRRVLRLPPEPAPPLSPDDEQAIEDRAPGLDPRTRGTLVHLALEQLDFADPQPPEPGAVRAFADAIGQPLTDDEVTTICEYVTAFADSPLCARLAAAARVRREAAFAFTLDPDGAGPLVSGLTDVLAQEPDGSALVVDYKTDHVADDDTPEALIVREYATQRLVYALAALRDGAPAVEVAHCLLERPAEPVSAVYTAADAPDLAAALLTLATGVVEHRYPVSDTPHRDLCAECAGRATLCSWPESVTLRPASSPAAPARRR